jgi:hypothetical protein
MHIQQFRIRTEVRSTRTSVLGTLMEPSISQTVFRPPISGLATGNDREVMESCGLVKTFCNGKTGNDHRSMAATIASALRELFYGALESMQQLPPEPIQCEAIAGTLTRARRA